MKKVLGNAFGAAALALAFAAPAMADTASDAALASDAPATAEAAAVPAETAAVDSTHAVPARPGKWQVKLFYTAVLAKGKITEIRKDLIGLPAGSQTDVNNNTATPTLAVEYFIKPNISVETICCFTSHHVTGTGALAGAALVDHVMILPATLTAKYHFNLPFGLKPYIGAGGAWFFYIDERAGATAQALGATRVHMNNNAGGVVQAGIDIPLNKQGLSFSLDAKKYWVDTTAHFYTANGTEALTTHHTLDPWVLSAGLAFRF
ncbi:MAG: OmpW family outer membrane protein [Novosphingobium aromaticivorans]|nr:OmpW family outer membrane protein [Novosphingobium aromaticivorans]